LAAIQLFEYLEAEDAKKKSKYWTKQKHVAFKVVQIKFLAMHITNQKCFDIYGKKFTKYLNWTWFLLNILIIRNSKNTKQIVTKHINVYAHTHQKCKWD